MTHFAEACRMIIAELNFWWPLLKKPVEWVRNELKVLNGCSIKTNYRFIWFNLVILCLQSTFNEFGDQLTGFWTS